MSILADHVGTRAQVRIERNRPSHPRINGYVLAASKTLALLHAFDDFEPDGYSIIRLEDVTNLRSGENERLWDRMLKGEGLLTGLDQVPRVDLANFRSAIESISVAYQTIVVECEDERDPLEDFYIGHLLSVQGKGIQFRHFDALGYWLERPAWIDLAEVTQVQFDTPYIRHFSKYARNRPFGPA